MASRGGRGDSGGLVAEVSFERGVGAERASDARTATCERAEAFRSGAFAARG